MTLHILRMCRVVFIFGLPREKKEVGNSVLQNRSGYMIPYGSIRSRGAFSWWIFRPKRSTKFVFLCGDSLHLFVEYDMTIHSSILV
jgi:hypothetical protein